MQRNSKDTTHACRGTRKIHTTQVCIHCTCSPVFHTTSTVRTFPTFYDVFMEECDWEVKPPCKKENVALHAGICCNVGPKAVYPPLVYLPATRSPMHIETSRQEHIHTQYMYTAVNTEKATQQIHTQYMYTRYQHRKGNPADTHTIHVHSCQHSHPSRC